jgi:hypothetical protein
MRRAILAFLLLIMTSAQAIAQECACNSAPVVHVFYCTCASAQWSTMSCQFGIPGPMCLFDKTLAQCPEAGSGCNFYIAGSCTLCSASSRIPSNTSPRELRLAATSSPAKNATTLACSSTQAFDQWLENYQNRKSEQAMAERRKSEQAMMESNRQ